MVVVTVITASRSYDNGGVREAIFDSATDNVTMNINIDSLVRYIGSISPDQRLFPSLDKGLSYIARELGHVTRWGRDKNWAMYQPDSHLGRERSAEEFAGNERFAWSMSNAILRFGGYQSQYRHPLGKDGVYEVRRDFVAGRGGQQ